MALLQISEPGASPALHQHKLAVGIDLGTTHSLVATIRHGVPEILQDAAGQALLPSVVHYSADGSVEGGRLVGHAALARLADDPHNTVRSIKRLMGRSIEEAHALNSTLKLSEGGAEEAPEKLSEMKVEETPEKLNEAKAENTPKNSGVVRLRLGQQTLSPVEISSHILMVLRERAEAALQGPLVGAVITVPAYFDDAQRQATRDAARLAGLNVLRLLNEPTAAAIAYGLENAAEGIYAVYDLGGGTFDVSILRLSRGIFEVIATGGDTALGGDDFDASIVQWVRASLPEIEAESAQDQQALMLAARLAREQLSDETQTWVRATLQSGTPINMLLTREQFDVLAAPWVARTLTGVRRALQDAQLQATDIKGVVMVGGATRMPIVQQAVETFFAQTPLTNLDPDKVVALGAALQANLLAGNRLPGEDWLLLDVIPLSLGLETMGGLVERIIPRNSTIPIARAQVFTTFKDGQRAMSLHVVQGERELVADCRSLAQFELQGIPPMAAGAARIQVTFQVDADGLLTVTAREQSTGVEVEVTVKPAYGLSDADIAQMLSESVRQADADARTRMLKEQQVEAHVLVESVRAALASDADLLEAQARARIDVALAAAEAAQAVDEVETVRHAVRHLTEVTEEFAARRMDRHIRAALSGRKLDEFA